VIYKKNPGFADGLGLRQLVVSASHTVKIKENIPSLLTFIDNDGGMDGACRFLSHQMGNVDGLSPEYSHNELGKLVGA
jgi:hypothetical protein